MPLRRLLLDSGAFTVWSSQNRGKQVSIDLPTYIEFCAKHPLCSYYVNLDVIPGVPNKKRTLTPSAIEAACKQGWRNYRQMIQSLPQDKVIPVYHMNDDIRWLVKYIEAGAPYIGISPANDMTTSQKMAWMGGLRKYLFDGAGRPVVRTHGFAVTSFDLMNFWEWYSVDSASWKLVAAWGSIYVPQTTNGVEDYSKSPVHIVTSPNTLADQKRMKHTSAMPKDGVAYERLMAYLDAIGVPLGKFTLKSESKATYKLNREAAEFWMDKVKGIVAVPSEHGVATHWDLRAYVNAVFITRANKVLPVKHIYFAGDPVPNPKVEFYLRRRLLSYHEMSTGGKKKYSCLAKHLELIGGG